MGRGRPPCLPESQWVATGGDPYGAALEAHFNAVEPDILAFVPEEGRFDRLRREAAALFERFPDPASRPPLFGVPVGVKDIFHVKGFPTRAGSALPPEELSGPEAASVTRLKEAGALILGKTVTTEFATFAPGETRNPLNPAHTPGGSSSGSAAAVAAGLCPLTLGTQTIGSISRPASYCGVVGFKPSSERISRAGVIPISDSLDHVGCFAPEVAGAARAAAVLIPDWRTVEMPPPPVFGIPRGPYLDRATSAGLAHFERVVGRLIEAGFVVREVSAFADFADLARRHGHLFDGEMARVHRDWFPRHEALYRPKTVEILRRGLLVTEEELAAARAGQLALRRELAALSAAHGIDLWISPAATGPAPPGLDATGDPAMNLPWTHAGLPTLALPAGNVESGLPMGLQLAARFGADEELFAWGAQLEPHLA